MKRERDTYETHWERETKEENTVIVSLTFGEVARRSQTLKMEGTKTKKDSRIGWKGRQREASDAPYSCCG